MCDTLAAKRGGAVWFAKNSDRQPQEPQRVEYHAAASGGAAKLRCTYIEIDGVADRLAVLISRPDWMWGAEMGVNEAGVAIGNEAVFSRRVMRRGAALLGMDLVRLGLERGQSAADAVEVIITLLEQYGQGGPAGYTNKNLRYDNSFMIADANDIFVVETAGRDWAVKRIEDSWAISNGYTLGVDYDRVSRPGECRDFKAANETWLMPRLAGAGARAAANREGIAAARNEPMSLAALASLLRAHANGDGFDGGSNRDVCMHAGGPLRPSATTDSMIAKLAPGETPRAAFTGASAPCISLFKPALFGASAQTVMLAELWESGAALYRRAKQDRAFRAGLRKSIAQAEPEILNAIECGDQLRAEALAENWADAWLPSGAPVTAAANV